MYNIFSSGGKLLLIINSILWPLLVAQAALFPAK